VKLSSMGIENRRSWGQFPQSIIAYDTHINDLEMPIMNHIA